MVRLDRIKLVSPLSWTLDDFDAEYFFNRSNSEGKEQEWILNSKKIEGVPFLLYIKFDFVSNELVLEFSAKVLGEKYPEGITCYNFDEVLQELTPFVKINRNTLYAWADVVSLDIKQDIPLTLIKKDFELLPIYLKYQKSFITKSYDSGTAIQKSLATKYRNFLLKFYDKENEIAINKNAFFLETLQDSESVIKEFVGKTRVELELKSKFLLRKYFEVHDLSINNILRNRGDPIQKVCQEIFDLEQDIGTMSAITTLAEYKQYLLLKECDFKIDLVEQQLRRWGSPKTNYRSAIRPYKKIISHYAHGVNANNSEEILNKIIHN